jgi:hypothetical protein
MYRWDLGPQHSCRSPVSLKLSCHLRFTPQVCSNTYQPSCSHACRYSCNISTTSPWCSITVLRAVGQCFVAWVCDRHSCRLLSMNDNFVYPAPIQRLQSLDRECSSNNRDL